MFKKKENPTNRNRQRRQPLCVRVRFTRSLRPMGTRACDIFKFNLKRCFMGNSWPKKLTISHLYQLTRSIITVTIDYYIDIPYDIIYHTMLVK